MKILIKLLCSFLFGLGIIAHRYCSREKPSTYKPVDLGIIEFF